MNTVFNQYTECRCGAVYKEPSVFTLQQGCPVCTLAKEFAGALTILTSGLNMLKERIDKIEAEKKE